MSKLQAGFSRLDVTPPLGVRIPGYFHERISDGILDPITVTAVAVSDGQSTALLCSLDLLGLSQDFSRKWAAAIAAKHGLSPEAIFLHCTHTHTGPVVDHPPHKSDPVYNEVLLRRLCDAAGFAIADLSPVAGMYWGERELAGITFLRRFKMKDGHVQTWGKRGDPEIEGPAGEADEALRLLRIVRENGPELLLVNFQLHPDLIHGAKFSADFPAFARETVERSLDNCRCAYFSGTGGNLNHVNVRAASWEPTGGYAFAQHLGRAVAGAVLQLHGNLEPLPADAGGVTFARASVEAQTKKDDSRIPEAERIIARQEAGEPVPTPVIAEARVIKRHENGPATGTLPVSVVSFGAAAFAGLPGEPFCEFGRLIRQGSPFRATFSCCLTNGNEGYFPVERAFDEGGYEPSGSNYRRGAGEKLTEAALSLLRGEGTPQAASRVSP